MSESQNPAGSGGASPSASTTRSRPKAGPRRKSAARPRKRAPAASRRGPRRARRAGSGSDVERLLRRLARSAGDAGARLAVASGTGARATRRAWTRLSDSSRKTIGKLAKQWSGMDPKRKAQLIAALVGALAAASAPIVRRRLKKR